MHRPGEGHARPFLPQARGFRTKPTPITQDCLGRSHTGADRGLLDAPLKEHLAADRVSRVRIRQLAKLSFPATNLGPALRNEIYQSTDQKIGLGTEPLHLAFARYPLVTKHLENESNLLRNLLDDLG
jgi:hypothetical protein